MVCVKCTGCHESASCLVHACAELQAIDAIKDYLANHFTTDSVPLLKLAAPG
jgi:hypothetical protein